MKEIHILSSGDNLEKINSLYNKDLCNLKVNNNKIGNFVEISSGADDFLVIKNYNPLIIYKVKPNETLLDIVAKGYEVLGSTNIEPNDLIILRRPVGFRHVVKPTESIQIIAKKYNVTIQDIVNKNNLKTPKLYIGQILSI